MKKFIITMLSALSLAACSNQAPKTLVLYYSLTETTQTLAQEIQAKLGADIELIELVEPYSTDYQEAIARCGQEISSGIAPEILPVKADLSQYDVIFLCYPVWYGTYCRPIAGLLEQESFEGKTVVACCTCGSGGLVESTRDLKAALPKATVLQGYGVRAARIASAPAELERYLIEAGFIEGEVEALPAFMEHLPVTEEQAAIFDKACSNYQMPLGTPVDVAVRGTSHSVDYEFTAQNGDASSTIYVTVEEGKEPEFTMVVR